MAAESRNSFFDSLVKIGQGFQDIFGIFGNAIGDALGFNAVKSGDKKSKVGEHFKKIGDGLTTIKDKLKELSSKISEAKNANSSTIEAVKSAIKGANDVFEQLIAALTKLADATKDDNSIGHNDNNAAAGAEKAGVEAIIGGIQTIIAEAGKSGISIKPGDAGGQVTAAANTAAPAVLGGHNNAAAGAGAGDKLAAEVSKADPWAMIDKIKNATATDPATLAQSNNNETGTLAAANANANDNNYGAKTNADLAAAVALKAMTKGGKFRADNADAEAVKAAAVSAVNKVLGVLNFIIRKPVAINLDKIREAVKGIQYSETTTESTEASTTQPTVTK
ncbi:Variable large protein B38 (plasmid) [Borrelia hermsii]|uniref:Variable large protein n=2 Tax=Borrelia hermsii TaxID=140 RepID=A0AAN0X7B7_BORHE|nr:Variable large protein B38 [Borrelia hermsii]ANA43972.1 VlpB38 [Borrelia hermsii HS1]UPA08361.1 variable large family protein [Borrelia hermsii DAH]